MSYAPSSSQAWRIARRLHTYFNHALPHRSSGQVVFMAGVLALVLFAASQGMMPGTRAAGYDPMGVARPIVVAEADASGPSDEERQGTDYLTQFNNAALEQEQLEAAIGQADRIIAEPHRRTS